MDSTGGSPADPDSKIPTAPPSLDAVKQFVDGATKAFSKNDYMAVEAANAMGLPK